MYLRNVREAFPPSRFVLNILENIYALKTFSITREKYSFGRIKNISCMRVTSFIRMDKYLHFEEFCNILALF